MSKLSRSWEETCGDGATSIRVAVAAYVAVFLGIGVFGIGNAWAQTRVITLVCPDQKEKKETLKPSESTVEFMVAGCFCRGSKEKLLADIVKPVPPGQLMAAAEAPRSMAEVGPGQTVKVTLYCITLEQFRALHAGSAPESR